MLLRKLKVPQLGAHTLNPTIEARRAKNIEPLVDRIIIGNHGERTLNPKYPFGTIFNCACVARMLNREISQQTINEQFSDIKLNTTLAYHPNSAEQLLDILYSALGNEKIEVLTEDDYRSWDRNQDKIGYSPCIGKITAQMRIGCIWFVRRALCLFHHNNPTHIGHVLCV